MCNRFASTVFGGASLALTLPLLPGPSYGQTQLPQVNVEATKKPPKRTAVRRPRTPPAANPAGDADARGRRRSARWRTRTPRSTKARRHPGADRHQLLRAGPQRHRGAAAGRQRVGREGAAAGARSVAGFGGQRRPARPQRARQRAIPDQRHHAARRRHRLRPDPGYQLRSASSRCITGALPAQYGLRTAGARRHQDPQRRLQQRRQRRASMAAATHRPIHAERRISDGDRRRRPHDISSPAAISPSNLGIENPTPSPTTRSTTSPARASSSATPRRSSTTPAG